MHNRRYLPNNWSGARPAVTRRFADPKLVFACQFHGVAKGRVSVDSGKPRCPTCNAVVRRVYSDSIAFEQTA